MQNDDDTRGELTPEQQQQIDQALTRAKSALEGVSRVGCLGLVFRSFTRSFFRFPRFTGRRMLAFFAGLGIVVLSITTCSAGVDLEALTRPYGGPVAASTDDARRFVERVAVAVQNAPTNRRFRITVTETEATSALSLGLMMPELSRAMQTMPADRVRRTQSIEELRALLKAHEDSVKASRTLRERIVAVFDPDLRTGDVQVRFTGRGQIVAAGYVEAWRFRQPALVVFAPRAQSGELELDFVRGKLGRLPAPSWAFDLMGRLVASMILQGRDYAEITNLTVEEGRLTFAARVTR